MAEGKIEEIGKIRLDLTHYPGEDLYCDGDVEDELLKITRWNHTAAESAPASDKAYRSQR